uniref:Uncharacterized protein n=1 Tax=Oryza meridionalis TaxID=40149 RepID=A0A0E0D3G9_9ORYZ
MVTISGLGLNPTAAAGEGGTACFPSRAPSSPALYDHAAAMTGRDGVPDSDWVGARWPDWVVMDDSIRGKS